MLKLLGAATLFTLQSFAQVGGWDTLDFRAPLSNLSHSLRQNERLAGIQQNPDVLLRYVISEGNDFLAAYPSPAGKRLITNEAITQVSTSLGTSGNKRTKPFELTIAPNPAPKYARLMLHLTDWLSNNTSGFPW